MGAKIQIPVTNACANVVTVPDHFKMADALQLALNQLGDGFFAFKGDLSVGGSVRFIKELNGEVIPNVGLKVGVRDFVALIDGTILTDKNKSQFDPSDITVLSVPANAVSYIVLSAKRIVGTDGINRPDLDKGVLTVETGLPEPDGGSIVVAKVTVPSGATQVMASMIDNSVKVYLKNMDNVTDGVSSSIEGIQSQIDSLRSQVNGLSGNVAGLTSDVAALSGAQSSLSILVDGLVAEQALQAGTITTLQGSVDALYLTMNAFQVTLSSLSGDVASLIVSGAIQAQQITDLSAAVNGITGELITVQTNISAILAALSALAAGQSLTQGQVDALNAQVDAIGTALSDAQSAISDLQTAIAAISTSGFSTLATNIQGNIALVNFKVDMALGVVANNMKKGYSDVFVDLADVDNILSENYALGGSGVQKLFGSGSIAVNPLCRFKFDGGLMDEVNAGDNWYLINLLYNFSTAVRDQGINITNMTPSGPYVRRSTGAARYYPVLNQSGFMEGSMSFWLNPGATYKTGMIVNLAEAMNVELVNNVVRVTSTGPYVSAPTALPFNTWSHISVTWVATDWTTLTKKIYINGVLVATGTEPMQSWQQTYYPTGKQFRILVNSQYYGLTGVSFDDLMYYGRELSAQDVAINAGLVVGSDAVVVSKAHSSPSVPTNALLICKVPAGPAPVFEMSRDNGTTWVAVDPNVVTAFGEVAEGQSMRLKATIEDTATALRAWSLWWD